MKEIVIAGAFRTAQGKLGSALRLYTNQKLGTLLLKGLFERTRVDPGVIDEVIFGCVGQQSDANNVSRVIAVQAGVPERVPAYTVNRNCGSGMQAVVSAMQAILSGTSEVVIAGGVEVMTASPFINRDMRGGKRLHDSVFVDSLREGLRDPLSGMMMGETAEVLAEEFGVGRKEQDAYALGSHQKACAATVEGRFSREIISVPAYDANGREISFLQDEGPLPGTSLEALAKLPTVFKKDGTVTAGNSSQISDGAAAMIVTTFDKAKSLGLKPMAFVRGTAFTGVKPVHMGLGPVEASKTALSRAGMRLTDIDIVEINEAFAAQYLAVERTLQLDRNRVNRNGGAISLGHPVGASGARILVTLLHEMERSNSRTGLAALCIGGGQGGALVLERI